jgi:hypothetical protein
MPTATYAAAIRLERPAYTLDIYPDGIRAVTRHREDWWCRYVVIPRATALRYVRRWHLGHAKPYHDCGWDQWLPEGLLQPEYYGGPGRPFVQHPIRLAYGRRYVVIVQTGGWDI